jgi:hypothetical protein
MTLLSILVLLIAINSVQSGNSGDYKEPLNLRPIIGILSEPDSDSKPTIAFFSASYVQWLQSAGARVALIPYDANETTLSLLMSSINGVLFTG